MAAPPTSEPRPDPSPSPTCRLTAAHVGDRDDWVSPASGDPFGPVFAAPPVLASDGATLVAVGPGVDGVWRVWAGGSDRLDVRAVLSADHHPAALTRVHGRWHVFGNDPSGHPCHATSTDLAAWIDDPGFASEHPNVVVRGAAAVDDRVVVLAEVVVQGRTMGWTLLHGAEDPLAVGGFHAREITFPLTPDHRVVGPAHVHGDEIALAVTSSATHTLARTVPGTDGRSWTLGLVSSPVTPVVVLARHRQVWVAGDDPHSGAPVLAVTGGRDAALDRQGGVVRAAVFHGDVLVLARCPVTGGSGEVLLDDRAEVPADAQSSPAYISSISLA